MVAITTRKQKRTLRRSVTNWRIHWLLFVTKWTRIRILWSRNIFEF